MYAQTLGAPSEILSRLKKIEDKLYLSKDVFTTPEASDYLGLAKSTIYKMTCLGEIPYIKRGKFIYFDRKELDEWIYNGHRNNNGDAIKELLNKK